MADAAPQTERMRNRPKETFDFFRDHYVRSVFYQLVTAGIFIWLMWYLANNTAHNLETRGMKTGFGFIISFAGFDIYFK